MESLITAQRVHSRRGDLLLLRSAARDIVVARFAGVPLR
jgi:hypothetical protein